MNRELMDAIMALDDYVGAAVSSSSSSSYGTIAVPIRLLLAIRRALQQSPTR